MVDIRNRQRLEKGKSRGSFLVDQSAILMSLCSICMKGKFWSILLLQFYVEGINLPTSSTFMAIKLLFEPLVYSNVPLSLLFS